MPEQPFNGSAMIFRYGRNNITNKERENLFCSYCKKPRHTREKCWKLHGKPTTSSLDWGNNQSISQAHMTTSQTSEKRPLQELHQEDKPEYSNITTSTPSGKISDSVGLYVLDNLHKRSWIIDSEATDHITPQASFFTTYTPCPSTRKITIADGSLAIVVGIGDVQLSPSFTLKNVLHVTELSTNLVSIQKFTTNIHYYVFF